MKVILNKQTQLRALVVILKLGLAAISVPFTYWRAGPTGLVKKGGMLLYTHVK